LSNFKFTFDVIKQKFAFSLLLYIFFLCAILWIVGSITSLYLNKAVDSSGFLVPGLVLPEPVERMVYLCLMIIVLPISFMTLALRFEKWPCKTFIFNYNHSYFLVIYGLILFFIWEFFHLKNITAILLGTNKLVYFSLLLLPFLILFENKVTSLLGLAVFILSIIYLFLATVFSIKSIDDSSIYIDEFNTIFYSVSQASQHKVCFVDYISQYGCYSQLMAPLINLFRIEHVVFFTIIFSGLMLLTYFLLFYISSKIIKSKLVLFMFMAIIMLTWRSWAFTHFSVSPYFQYWPLRIVFPIISLYLYYKYWITKSNYYIYSLLIAGVVGVYWNVDSGVAVLYAIFSSGIIYHFTKTWFQYLLFLITLVIIIAISLVLTNSGFAEYFSTMFSSHISFFISGFNMLALPVNGHLWQLILILYVSTVFYYAYRLKFQELLMYEAISVYLAFLGFGLFLYYQGRSHDFNLIGVIWPALMILAIHIDRGLLVRKHAPMVQVSYGLFIAVGILSFTKLIFGVNVPLSTLKYNLQTFSSQKKSLVESKADFISENCPKNDCFVISRHQGVLFDRLAISNDLSLKGFGEILTVKEMNDLFIQINKSKRNFFIDDNSDWMLNGFVKSKMNFMPYESTKSGSGMTYYSYSLK